VFAREAQEHLARHKNSPVFRASQPLSKTAQKNHYRQSGGVASLNFNKILDERRSKRVPRQGSLRGFRLQCISPKDIESEGNIPPSGKRGGINRAKQKKFCQK